MFGERIDVPVVGGETVNGVGAVAGLDVLGDQLVHWRVGVHLDEVDVEGGGIRAVLSVCIMGTGYKMTT